MLLPTDFQIKSQPDSQAPKQSPQGPPDPCIGGSLDDPGNENLPGVPSANDPTGCWWTCLLDRFLTEVLSGWRDHADTPTMSDESVDKMACTQARDFSMRGKVIGQEQQMRRP